MNKCCIPKIDINSYVSGTTNFQLMTSYSFANALNCDTFILDLLTDIPSQTTIKPVSLQTSSGTPAVLNLIGCLGNNVMSDQLVGVGSLCVKFGSNPAHLKIVRALNQCGCEIKLRPSAFYVTQADSPVAKDK